MNEVEKMYKNIGILPGRKCEFDEDCPLGFSHSCDDCDIEFRESNSSYPPFTAEKQIEVENIIFQCNFGICELQRTMPAEFTKDNRFVKHYFAWQYHAGDIGYYNETTEEPYGDWDVEYSNPDRKEALAGFVNTLWDEYLTEEERKQIKEILE